MKNTISVFRIDFVADFSIKTPGASQEVGEWAFFLDGRVDRIQVARQLRRALHLIENGDQVAGASPGN